MSTLLLPCRLQVVPLPITEVATGIGFEYYPLVSDEAVSGVVQLAGGWAC